MPSAKNGKNDLRNNDRVRMLVVTAVLAAVSSVLMMFSFSVPLMPPFISMDFSELPAVIASFSFGPLWGVAVCLVKNLVNVTMTSTGGVGELSNFLLGATMTLTAGLLYRVKPGRPTAALDRAAGKVKNEKVRKALLGFIRSRRPMVLAAGSAGALAMAAVSLLTNYYITYPIYTNFMPMEAIMGAYQAIAPWVKNLWQALLVFNVPFTFIKGFLSVLISVIVAEPIMKAVRIGSR